MNLSKHILLITALLIQCMAAGTVTIANLVSADYQEYKELNKKTIEQSEPYIFAMTTEDLPECALYWKKIVKKATPKQGQQQNLWILVAKAGNKFVGFIEAQRKWTNESYLKHVATITKIFVDKEHQKQGIGTQLMNEMISLLAQDPTITALDLRVSSNQPAAIQFYKKFGFEVVNPHKHASQVDHVFHPHYCMKTCIQKAVQASKKIKRNDAAKIVMPAAQQLHINIITLDLDNMYPYREINIRSLEQNEPHIFAIAPEDEEGLLIDHWKERLELAQKKQGQQQNLWILAAESEGTLIGLIEAEREAPKHSYKKHLVCITKVFVDNNYHGKGVGKQLMHAMIDLLHQDTTVTAVELWVAAYGANYQTNPVINFYKSFGFQEANPHDYAVSIDQKFYSQHIMSTTIETAKENVKKIMAN